MPAFPIRNIIINRLKSKPKDYSNGNSIFMSNFNQTKEQKELFEKELEEDNYKTWKSFDFLDEVLIGELQEKIGDIPSKVQRIYIPKLLSNDKNTMCRAPTGSGKTLTYVLPLLMNVNWDMNIQFIVITPKKLIKQVFEVFRIYNLNPNVIVKHTYNKKEKKREKEELKKSEEDLYRFLGEHEKCHILVSSLEDLYKNNSKLFYQNEEEDWIDCLKDLKRIIVDEVDGIFQDDINEDTIDDNKIQQFRDVFGSLATKPSYSFFSATQTEGITTFIKTMSEKLEKELFHYEFVHDDDRINRKVGHYNIQSKNWHERMSGIEKSVMGFIENNKDNKNKCIIFCKKDQDVEMIANRLITPENASHFIKCHEGFKRNNVNVVEINTLNEPKAERINNVLHHVWGSLKIDNDEFKIVNIGSFNVSQKEVFKFTYLDKDNKFKIVYDNGLGRKERFWEKKFEFDDQRVMSLTRSFKTDETKVLICTDDIAARGYDPRNVSLIINYDLPKNSQTYVHRAGRSARGINERGVSLTFCNNTNNCLKKEGQLSEYDLIRRIKNKQNIEIKNTPLNEILKNF